MHHAVSHAHEHERLHDRLLALPEVEHITGFKSSFIYAEVKKGNFPKPIKINAASRWLESKVRNWLNQQIEKATQNDQ